MKIVIIKYNAGNIRSVYFALQRIGVESVISDDPVLIRNADKVIFPGVGEASSTMRNLSDSGLDICIKELKQPVLGICLGLQLMCSCSEEGDTRAFDIFDTEVRKFPYVDSLGVSLKVPHMGWNSLENCKGPLFKGLPENPYVYFVHSYYAVLSDHAVASSTYGLPFASALQKDNFFATQFHPEKSGSIGEQILSNFLSL